MIPSLTVRDVLFVPFIAINLLGFIFNVPSPDIIKEAPFCRYIVPSFSLEDESIKVDSPSKTISTSLFSSINIGVKEPLFDIVTEFKFIVQEEDAIIFLSVREPSKS